jgi:hypothetical protein
VPKASTRKDAKGKAPAKAGTTKYLKQINQALIVELGAIKEELKHTKIALSEAIDPPITEQALHENMHKRLALAVEQSHFAAAAIVIIRGNVPHHSFAVGRDPSAFFKLFTGVAAMESVMLDTLTRKEGITDGKEVT